MPYPWTSRPRWGGLLVAIGIVPLSFGALVWQGIDYVGAVVVGAGLVGPGFALREPVPDRHGEAARVGR